MLRATPAMKACAFSARLSKTRTRSRSVSWTLATSGSAASASACSACSRLAMSSSATVCSSARRCSSLHEDRQRRFHRFAALRQPVQEARAVEVAEAGDPRRVRLRFEIAPGRQLRQRGIDFLDARRRLGPLRLGQHLVGPQLQAVLPLGGGEDVHDAAVERRLLGADMPEQLGRVVHGGSARCKRRTAASRGAMRDCRTVASPQVTTRPTRHAVVTRRG